MDSIGARLKDIRLKKGLSLDEAHAQTKINVNILKAIEDDNLANISPVYLKGFIKIYCAFLGVDPKDFSPEQKQQQPPPPPVAKVKEQVSRPAQPKEVRLRPVKVKIDPMIIKALAVGMVIGLLFFGVKSLHLGSRKPKAVSNEPAPTKIKAPPKKNSLKAVQKKPSGEPSARTTKAAAVPSPKEVRAPAPAPTAPEVISGIRLGIHAKEDCWVQLKIDGKAVFQSVLRKGRYEVWQAKDRMELSLGNVGGVEIELNGKMLQPLGRRGQSLKNILITQEGLKVEK